jgi:hypothetical protein
VLGQLVLLLPLLQAYTALLLQAYTALLLQACTALLLPPLLLMQAW